MSIIPSDYFTKLNGCMLGSGVIVKFHTDMRRCLYNFVLNRAVIHPARPSLHKLYNYLYWEITNSKWSTITTSTACHAVDSI